MQVTGEHFFFFPHFFSWRFCAITKPNLVDQFRTHAGPGLYCQELPRRQKAIISVVEACFVEAYAVPLDPRGGDNAAQRWQ
jgi:hypothetical protein